MRIAVIAPPWLAVPPTGYGGTEQVLDGLCLALQEAGHEVLLYATGDSTCPVERAWTFDTSVGVAAMHPAAELRQVIAAYDAVADWGADIVHDHTLVGPFAAAAAGTGWAGCPVVTTNHGPFDADLAPVYLRVAERVPVIAISHHQAAGALGVPIKAVIHHGVDPARFPVGDGAGGYALFLGRMNPEKGVHRAIRVAQAAGVPIKIGAKMRERAEHEYFRDQVRPLLGPAVEYLGEVGGEQKLELIGDAACLLNPIAWPEPFGLVMVEALACGTPVVTTPQGAAPEIVDDGTTGFVRSDEQSLVVALGHVGGLDRAACRAAVEQRFSAARMAADHVEVFERVLRRAAGPRSGVGGVA